MVRFRSRTTNMAACRHRSTVAATTEPRLRSSIRRRGHCRRRRLVATQFAAALALACRRTDGLAASNRRPPPPFGRRRPSQWALKATANVSAPRRRPLRFLTRHRAWIRLSFLVVLGAKQNGRFANLRTFVKRASEQQQKFRSIFFVGRRQMEAYLTRSNPRRRTATMAACLNQL